MVQPIELINYPLTLSFRQLASLYQFAVSISEVFGYYSTFSGLTSSISPIGTEA